MPTDQQNDEPAPDGSEVTAVHTIDHESSGKTAILIERGGSACWLRLSDEMLGELVRVLARYIDHRHVDAELPEPEWERATGVDDVTVRAALGGGYVVLSLRSGDGLRRAFAIPTSLTTRLAQEIGAAATLASEDGSGVRQ